MVISQLLINFLLPLNTLALFSVNVTIFVSAEKHPDAGRDWRQVEKGKTEDEMVGWMASPT